VPAAGNRQPLLEAEQLHPGRADSESHSRVIVFPELAEVKQTPAPALNPQNAVRVATQVPLQIVPQVRLRTTMRVGRKVALAVPARIQPQITFRKGPQVPARTGREIAGKTPPPTPASTSLEVTPGTVLGTVPTPVRRASFSAWFLRAFALTCGATWS
jgi:hypothetical protein